MTSLMLPVPASYEPTSHRPAHDVVTVRLRGGRLVELRPLRHGERDALLAVFDGMSPESRALRYLTGMLRMPSATLDLLTDVDGDRHVAWLASAQGQPVGIARYVRDDAGIAEVAVEVVDDHQGLGIGSALVDAVTTVAAARGVHRVRALLSPGQRSFAALGHPHRSPTSGGRRPPGGRGPAATPAATADRPTARPRAGPAPRTSSVRPVALAASIGCSRWLSGGRRPRAIRVCRRA